MPNNVDNDYLCGGMQSGNRLLLLRYPCIQNIRGLTFFWTRSGPGRDLYVWEVSSVTVSQSLHLAGGSGADGSCGGTAGCRGEVEQWETQSTSWWSHESPRTVKRTTVGALCHVARQVDTWLLVRYGNRQLTPLLLLLLLVTTLVLHATNNYTHQIPLLHLSVACLYDYLLQQSN